MKKVGDRDDPIWKTYAEQDTDEKHSEDDHTEKDLEHN